MDPLFEVHKLNNDGMQKANNLAAAFNDLLTKLNTMCPQGREFSIVKTKLEEACFFAKKSLATQPENHLV